MNTINEIKDIYLRDGRVLNSYLISGKKGQTIAFANKFANAILSIGSFSNSQSRINAEVHPDVIVFKAKNDKYTVEDARNIVNSSYEAPFENEKKVIIIEDFSLFAPIAQNILLKVLEEPQDKTVFILLSENKDKILSTILSRLSEIRIKPMSLDDYKDKLTGYKYDQNQISYLYYFTNGDYLLSRDLLENQTFFEEKSYLLKTYSKYLNGNKVSLLDIASFFESKEDVGMYTSIISFFLRDASVYKIDKNLVYDEDSIDLFHTLNDSIDYQKNLLTIEEIRRRINANVSVKNAFLASL